MVRFSRVEELPADAAAVDRETYRKLGITSQVEVPLKVGGALLGTLTFSTLGAERAWPDELVQRLQLLGEVFANVLSRRQSEMEAQRLRRDLAHVGRVSTMGALTASLAHELNQPLTAILSNAQAAQRILRGEPVKRDEILEILTEIVEDDKRAGEVIYRLRGLLKKGGLEFTLLDVNEMVGEVARLVSGDAVLRNVAVRLDLAPHLPLVRGDRVQLQQVVMNLVLNGLDAIRESAGTERTLVLWTAKEDPAAVRIAVRDSGTGIDEVDLDHIFQAFYTTKTDGLGMGLAIALSIVEAHGGRLGARNNPGRWRDPRVHAAGGGPGVMSARAPALVSVVDDDPSVRRSLARLVKGAGYRVEAYASANEFLARPRRRAPPASCWIVRMPGLTGLDLQETLAIAAHSTSIVFITGYRDVRASVKAMKGGAVDFLTKPVDDEELLGAIERAVARASAARPEEDRVTEVRERIKTLTPREAEVFALVVTGMLNKQIAFDLGVSGEDGQGASRPRHGEDARGIARGAGPAGRRGRRDLGEVLIARAPGSGARRRSTRDQGPLSRRAPRGHNLIECRDVKLFHHAPDLHRRRRPVRPPGAPATGAVGGLHRRDVRVRPRVPSTRCRRPHRVPGSRHPPGGNEWVRAPGADGGGPRPHPGHLHHRPRRRRDARARPTDERVRVPAQAIRRAGPARCDRQGHRANGCDDNESGLIMNAPTALSADTLERDFPPVRGR